MHWLKTIAGEIVSEIYGLFVDDASFALAILLWLAAAWMARPYIAPGWQGAVLASGLVLILIESLLRASARTRR